MPVKEVVAEMTAKGMKVTPNLVYFIKGKLKGTKKRRKRIVKAAKAAATRNGSASRPDAVALIRNVKELAGQAGGFEKLKELVDALAE